MAVGLFPVLTDDPGGESTPVLLRTENSEMVPALVPALALSSTKAKRGLSLTWPPQPARIHDKTHNKARKPGTRMAFFTFTDSIMQITVNHLSQLPGDDPDSS